MLQVTGGIGDYQESRSLAISPPEFLECTRIKRHWSKALHAGVAQTCCHRVATVLEDRHPKITFVCDSKPIAISPSHCIKSLHACACSTAWSFNFVLLGWWLLTSGDLVDSRGAEKGVSQTRSTRTLRWQTLYVKCRIYVLTLLDLKSLIRTALFRLAKGEHIARLASECFT